MESLERVATRFPELAPDVDFWSLRLIEEQNQHLLVRQGVVQPVRTSEDTGAMVTVVTRGGLGYAATPDLTDSGLRRAADEARDWARRTAAHSVLDFSLVPQPAFRGEYETHARVPWESIPLTEKLDLLRAEADQLRRDSRIADWSAGLWHTRVETVLASSAGALTRQRFRYLLPTMSATAHRPGESQTRTFGGHSCVRQGGLEILEDVGFTGAGARIGEEALELLAAPNCPSGVMELLLAPDQMILQLHESIGHPLELDRILGDERNYAGRSFVEPDMFGVYRYGSELLNVTFDPTVSGEQASYAFDDEGQPARREEIIRHGILLRPLGGLVSATRARLPPIANARATSWNRPVIDRMANLNLEPGDSSFDEMVASVEAGVTMETNCSWSIDDSRNKFQFGCERGRRIERGQLTVVVKNPNYRGVSATFWRNLVKVGDRDTFRVLGSPYCGKGEPNQVIRVGHAAPACLFTRVDVFGGA